MTTISGEVSRLRYSDSLQGFAVFDVEVSGPARFSGAIVTAVGPMPGVAEGLEVRLSGEFRDHPRFGRQFRFVSGMTLPPSTGRGLRSFLSSGRVEGIGKVLAGKLADHFGDDLRRALDGGPEALMSCPGIGRGRAGAISRAWRKGVLEREAMILLGDLGLTPGQASKTVALWGAEAPARVAADPWSLQRHLRGFGFRTADRIATAMGIDPESPLRLRAAVNHVMVSATEAGHLFIPQSDLVSGCCELTGVPDEPVTAVVTKMALEGLLVREDSREHDSSLVYLAACHAAEVQSAALLATLGRCRVAALSAGPAGTRLAPSQLSALETVCSSAVSILTGGPGTGKTTVTGELISICRSAGVRLALAAPTGRAAMRLREASGFEAQTLHRLLEYNPGTDSFARDMHNPVAADWVVVDESSMIDMHMFLALVRAIRPGCRLTFVGDQDQLPPVGPGDPFRRMIASGVVPVARLTEIFRQGEGSSIVAAAHDVISGIMPAASSGSAGEPGDFHVVFRESPEDAASMVATLVCDRIPARFGLDPRQDVQVLSPMKKGSCGTDELNALIRGRLNPDAPPGSVEAGALFPGDRVIQTRNNYDLDIFNGDIGVVVNASGDGNVLVRFDKRNVLVSGPDLDDIAPAAAVTVHKAQGSEFPAVVVCLHNQHFMMLRRNLLYTAITRGRRLVVLVGGARAVRMAVDNLRQETRFTMLDSRLAREYSRLGERVTT